MKTQLKKITAAMEQHNHCDLACEEFGLSREKRYDLLVIAPSWKPEKVWKSGGAVITCTHAAGPNTSGWEIQLGDYLIAWVQTGCGACCVIDHMLICAKLNFDKILFLGAVGGLKKEFEIGDICTPSTCTEGTMAPAYLMDDPRALTPFGKVTPEDLGFIDRVVKAAGKEQIPIRYASVFCTESISCEYYHLDFIRAFDTDLIEMETSGFYRVAGLMEKPAIALLVVSDNSASGKPLLGRSEEQRQRYNIGRQIYMPRLIQLLAAMKP